MNTSILRERLGLYARLMRLDKPIGTLLLLWPTLWAVWIAADGRPYALHVAVFAIGTLLMRSAGCVVNDMADARFDGHVRRTRERPIAAGRVSRTEAFGLFTVLLAISFGLVLLLNSATVLLSLVALFLAASYPFTKRFLALPQAYLGIAFGFGIPMAFAARLGEVPALGWAMLAANIFWAIGYDTEYAMVDREDDLKIGIRTAAITFGSFDVAAVMLAYAITLAILFAVGRAAGLGAAFLAGLAVAAGMMIYHYVLIRRRDPARCFKAFLHNNWVGAAIFAGIAADYAWPR